MDNWKWLHFTGWKPATFGGFVAQYVGLRPDNQYVMVSRKLSSLEIKQANLNLCDTTEVEMLQDLNKFKFGELALPSLLCGGQSIACV